MMLDKAIQIAVESHAGQVDKSGVPYICHPIAVMMSVDGELAKTVAILHDVVEDTFVTLMVLENLGFSRDVVTAVDAMTKRDNEPYSEYLMRVKSSKIATQVKLADIAHNTKLSRLKNLEGKFVLHLIAKYADAKSYLLG